MPPAAVRAVGRLEAAFSGRAASLVLAACLLGNVIYAVLGAERYGQSWDDPAEALQ